ncbi:hypothetical protein GDO81_018038 [Engystomops pustulosus]|uniref:Chondroadherin-like protein n=1 Tax=Engystomops pustulosus TaxID=76066 RepID=A0AAV7ACE8_ENGPU|nr:hypothetical protein GDO81_018038 [Engystomops pustulosus]
MKMKFLHYFLVLSFASTILSDPCPQVCICDNIKTFVTCANKNLTEIPPAIPQYTQKLTLQKNELKIIPSGVFLATPYLTHLSLQNCSIETIEEGAFRNLARLRYLNLGSNRISFIQQESFDGLSSLEQLILEKNRIEEIKLGAFSQLGSLNLLNLEDNFLVYLPDMVFQGLMQLKLMRLSKNMISIVSIEAFAGLPNLKRLSLDHNEVQYLPNEALSRLSGLTRLELGWNPMTFILEEAIQMASLKQILLNNNALQDVSFKAFEKSKQLSFIDMSNNQIRSIQPLSGMDQLKRLNLTGNTIICDCFLKPFKQWADFFRIKVDLHCFGPSHFLGDHLDSLRAIDLKCGNFPDDVYKIPVATEKPDTENACPQSCDCKTDVKHAICENKSLQKIPKGFHVDTTLIDLRRNFFHSIPKGAFLDMKNVASLHLQNCEISDIEPEALMGMKNLVYLYLSHNKISSLKPEVFQGAPKIGYVFLDHNRFTNIPKETLRLLPNLFSLHMQHNSIDSLSNNNMAGAQKLHWLYLTGNKINYIAPTAFRDMKDLEKLHLDDNLLSEVPTQALKGINKLIELRLSKNPIKNIGNGAFVPVSQSMQHLYLNDMRLQQISSGAFLGLGKKVKSLFLENNNLQNLPNMKNFNGLEVINLANNPFNCNCQLLHLHKWINSLNLKVGAKCVTPKSLRGHDVRNAKFISCPGWESNKNRNKRKIPAISSSKKKRPRKS